MIIDLITIGNSPHQFSFSVSDEEIDLGEEANLKNPAKVEGILTKHIAQTDVEGTIESDIELECSRCLQKVRRKFEIIFNVAFVASENYTSEKEAELNAKDLDISIIDGNEIDLTEIVREQILLNLPEQIFCREDCQGLCQKCGANRNLINCNCIEKEIDPRWSALKNLK